VRGAIIEFIYWQFSRPPRSTLEEAGNRLTFSRTSSIKFYLCAGPNLQLGTGMPDGIFSNQKWGKFWRVFQWKLLVYLMDIWYSLRPFGIFYGHLVYFVVIWSFFRFFVVPIKIWQPWLGRLLWQRPTMKFKWKHLTIRPTGVVQWYHRCLQSHGSWDWIPLGYSFYFKIFLNSAS
jgi:hypothetical protein